MSCPYSALVRVRRYLLLYASIHMYNVLSLAMTHKKGKRKLGQRIIWRIKQPWKLFINLIMNRRSQFSQEKRTIWWVRMCPFLDESHPFEVTTVTANISTSTVAIRVMFERQDGWGDVRWGWASSYIFASCVKFWSIVFLPFMIWDLIKYSTQLLRL